jgi:hypothetical protein
MENKDPFLAFSTVLLSFLRDDDGKRVGPIEVLRRTLRDEVFYIVLRVLAGLVLAATIIYAIFNAGDAFSVITGQYEYGPVYELIGFAVLALLAAASLYFVLQGSRKSTAVPRLNYDLIAIKFIEGFADGLQQPSVMPDKKEELTLVPR